MVPRPPATHCSAARKPPTDYHFEPQPRVRSMNLVSDDLPKNATQEDAMNSIIREITLEEATAEHRSQEATGRESGRAGVHDLGAIEVHYIRMDVRAAKQPRRRPSGGRWN
jgi:hypothetical protein